MGQSCLRPAPNGRSVAVRACVRPVRRAIRKRCETDAVTVTDSWDMPLRTKLLARVLSRTRDGSTDALR